MSCLQLPLVARACWVLWLASAWNQTAPPSDPGAPPAVRPVSREQVESRRRDAAALEAAELEESQKAEALRLYDQALGELEAANGSLETLGRYEQMTHDAPRRQAELEAQTAAPGELPPLPASSEPLADLQQALAEREAELVQMQEKWNSLQSEPARRTTRQAAIAQAVTEVRGKLEEVTAQLAAPAPPETPAPLLLAQRTFLTARRQTLEAVIRSLEAEKAAYEATSKALTLERDLLAVRVPQLRDYVERLRMLVQRRSAAEAQRQKEEAERRAQLADPAVKHLAEANSQLAAERQLLEENIREVTARLDDARTKLERLRQAYQQVMDKVDAAGLDGTIGLKLRRLRAELREENVNRLQERLAERQRAMRQANLRRLDLQYRRAQLANLDLLGADELEAIDQSKSQLDEARLIGAIMSLLESEREMVDQLQPLYDQYFNLLAEANSVRRSYVELIDEFSSYIDEHVLWIPSGELLGTRDLREAAAGAPTLAQGETWEKLWGEILAALRAQWLPLAGTTLVFLGLLWRRRWLVSRLAEIGEQVEGNIATPIWQTLEAVVLSLLLALPYPLLFAMFGWRLRAATEETVQACGAALLLAAELLLVLGLARQLVRGKGLVDAHFRWPSAVLRIVRGALRTLLMLLLPGALVVGFTQLNFERDHALGRLAFVATLAALGAFNWWLLRPRGRLFRTWHVAPSPGWRGWLRESWRVAAIVVPLLLAGLAAAGYYYTAWRLARELSNTLLLVLLLAVLGGIALRWVMIARLRLARAQMESRREADASLPPAELDLSDLTAQSRQLLRTFLLAALAVGLWFIWVDVLPALERLRALELWTTTVKVDGIDRASAITAADLALALLVVALMWAAVKNLPGLLEMAAVRVMTLDAGARYAMAALVRYGIVLAGIMSAAALLGFSWSKIQWIAAAATVGLGFGLQEIFANFISGLIILFERPFRIGDVVTVGQTSGRVTRIQMRATTIMDWDNRELLVPNKDLVTGNVINWTRTDAQLRAVIKIGLAYGSDTELARRILLDIARRHPHVLADPPPAALFREFGDSALIFELRIHSLLEHLLETVHELHTSIDKAFREAGLEIAFPQRDLHIRSVSGLPPALSPGGNGSSAHGGKSAPAQEPHP